MSEKSPAIPVTDEERRIFTPDNISNAFAKHYGRGYGHSPIQGPLTEAATKVENSIIVNRDSYGAPHDPFRSDYVQGVVLSSLVARVSEKRDA